MSWLAVLWCLSILERTALTLLGSPWISFLSELGTPFAACDRRRVEQEVQRLSAEWQVRPGRSWSGHSQPMWVLWQGAGPLRKGMCPWPFFNTDRESPPVRRRAGNETSTQMFVLSYLNLKNHWSFPRLQLCLFTEAFFLMHNEKSFKIKVLSKNNCTLGEANDCLELFRCCESEARFSRTLSGSY